MPDSCSLHALSLYHFFVFFQSSYFQSSSQLRTHRATFNARYCFAMLYSLTVIKHHHHSCFLSPSTLFTSLIIYTQCFDLKISILIHSDIHRQCYTFFSIHRKRHVWIIPHVYNDLRHYFALEWLCYLRQNYSTFRWIFVQDKYFF